MSLADEIPGISESPKGTMIELKVVPRASRPGLQLGADGLRLRVSSPPVEGAANAEIVKILSKMLAVPKSAVEIVGGLKGRRKRIVIHGIDAVDAVKVIKKAIQ